MNISDGEFIMYRQNQRNMTEAQAIVDRQAANHRVRKAALRRQLADALAELEVERGRRRHAEFRLVRATN